MGLTDRSFTVVVDLPSLLSLVIFVGTACLSLRRQENTSDTTVTSSVSSEDVDNDEDVAKDTSQDDERAWYLRRRLQHRLSFSYATAEDERATPAKAAEPNDFLPKNSNWHHFEHAHDPEGSSASRPDTRPRPVLSVHASLAGEAMSSKDEISTDDEEFSLTSADHFVWTQAHYSPKNTKQICRTPALPNREIATTTTTTTTAAAAPQPDVAVGSGRPLFPPPPVTRTRRSISMPLSDKKDELHVVRANYNARIMPNKVILLRHGQSQGNIDETIYSRTPDNAIPLTELGWEQARAAGQRLRFQVLPQNSSIHFIVSPYVRTVETFHGILSAWLDPKSFGQIADRQERIKAWYSKLLDMGITWAEDPRIREQDFGNLQNPQQILQSKRDRSAFGAFYYRFANGESAADVFDRISTFLDSLWRSFDMNKSQYFVIITHGIAVRVLLSRYFRYTIDQFHFLSNPRNCEMIELEHDGEGRLQLAGRHDLCTETGEDTCDNTVLRYRFHRRLRVLPQQYVRTVKVRISQDDEGG